MKPSAKPQVGQLKVLRSSKLRKGLDLEALRTDASYRIYRSRVVSRHDRSGKVLDSQRLSL